MSDPTNALIVIGVILLAIGMGRLIMLDYVETDTKRAECALQGKFLVKAYKVGKICVEGTEP